MKTKCPKGHIDVLFVNSWIQFSSFENIDFENSQLELHNVEDEVPNEEFQTCFYCEDCEENYSWEQMEEANK